ncbi:MAG: aspartate--tRNA(Asn) ligase [Candidatus Moranbacteria bacterium]|nr:aspartate--tRNA(Asn) ligase [Candidatus Moranbacteria bacterium]
MERTMIGETPGLIGQVVKLQGWVNIRRDHGKLIFIDLRDRSGKIQMVIIPDKEEAHKAAKEIRGEYIIEVEGLVKARPGGAKNEKLPTGGVEIEVEKLNIISKPEVELPIDVSTEDLNLNLDTLLDNRTIALRNDKIKSIFRIYSELLRSYAEVMNQAGFTEIKTPKILNAATEGGANFFKIKYFEQDAFLAQSPQFYKQAMAGVFERVFEIGPLFRAEPHFTTRHVNEFIGLDGEMAFVDSFEDVMAQLEKIMILVMASIAKNCQADLEKYEAQILPVEKIPRMKLTEALDILDKEYGKKMEEVDIDAEGERMICDWVKKNHNCDFVFLTHYPTSIRPFYSMPSADPQYTETFDLLFMGVEIASGGQRIHDYNQLVASMQKHKLNPEDFKHYLDIFKYGIPPHGGWGLGSERIVQKILGLGSIKEAILFPRDVKRLTP